MFGLGLPEIVVILIIVLAVFGVGKLPEVGSGLGRAVRGFKKSVSEQTEIDVTPPKDHSGDKKD
ncbi:MAG TPA: twin-arginine translocase TatA/TatE family subunit [Nitrospiria bacterium]|nr:twin-arginine translocase TatA/TatE family subunit [Nitrospiria bacterium]HUK55177.1 twin-arginine translocase TatA/TatE family subunit [Nitrospiria bacterium]